MSRLRPGIIIRIIIVVVVVVVAVVSAAVVFIFIIIIIIIIGLIIIITRKDWIESIISSLNTYPRILQRYNLSFFPISLKIQ
jgi:hypothetical protein